MGGDILTLTGTGFMAFPGSILKITVEKTECHLTDWLSQNIRLARCSNIPLHTTTHCSTCNQPKVDESDFDFGLVVHSHDIARVRIRVKKPYLQELRKETLLAHSDEFSDLIRRAVREFAACSKSMPFWKMHQHFDALLFLQRRDESLTQSDAESTKDTRPLRVKCNGPNINP